MDILQTKTISVTVDKSHLVTIGERLYSQSLELIRELVANAYDADATHVWIELAPYMLTVRDNGSGMDEAGLNQYFNIGSQEKRFNKKSPLFRRVRIGEFGIGKFAVLSACDVFVIFTQKDDFAAQLTFDKNVWNAIDAWEIPIHILKPNSARGNGIMVTLERLNKQLTLPDIERFLKERAPLKVPNFKVFLNGKQITPIIIPGKKFPIRQQSSYGLIHGEITIPHFPMVEKEEQRGIECFVKEIFVRRETFDFEYSHSFGLSHLRGEIHADFLPLTSDRSRFITDSAEYQEFYRIMRFEIREILKKMKEHVFLREDKKADSVIRDALSHILKALKKNPGFAPVVRFPTVMIGKEKKSPEPLLDNALGTKLHSNTVIPEEPADFGAEFPQTDSERKKSSDRSSKKVKVRTLNGKEITARKMQIGNFSVVCRAEQLGEMSPPVTWDSGIIFINRDHPLYRRFVRNTDTLTLFVTELITQEIAKLRASSSKEAFSLQNQILTDAWA